MIGTIRLQSIISGEDPTIFRGVLCMVLSCLQWPYRLVVRIRNAQFDSGLRSSRRLGCLTVSVGNLTTGGTGKTPVVIDLARRFGAKGMQPAILLRGYKAGRSGSDEAKMIRQELGLSVPVDCDSDRLAAANRVKRENPQVSVFLLDDGFQHRQVYRDLDLVLVDATAPFGFGHVLPRGLLREPVRNLRRAHAVIVTRADQISSSQLEELDRQIHQVMGRAPIAHVAHQWEVYRGLSSVSCPLADLSDSRVVGVCGIGNPGGFERSLKKHVGEVLKIHVFPDHHFYNDADIRLLLHRAAESKVDAVVTTHKDFVKWQPILDSQPFVLPVYYPVVRLVYLDGEEAVESLLQTKICDAGSELP